MNQSRERSDSDQQNSRSIAMHSKPNVTTLDSFVSNNTSKDDNESMMGSINYSNVNEQPEVSPLVFKEKIDQGGRMVKSKTEKYLHNPKFSTEIQSVNDDATNLTLSRQKSSGETQEGGEAGKKVSMSTLTEHALKLHNRNMQNESVYNGDDQN